MVFVLNIFLGTANFNAFNGCLKCSIVGHHQKELHMNVFPTALASKRTDSGFRNRIYEGHHQTYKTRENGKIKMFFVETPLLQLPIDIVEDIIVSDSLHLLHLGITKRLLTIYKDGHLYHKKWSSETVSTIDK